MGLFSSKKKITVNVTVQPVFEENKIPNSVQGGVLKYIMDGDITSLSDSITEELTSSIGTKINTGYGWAKKNDFKAGIPTSSIHSNIDVRNTVLGIIASNVNQPITPDYYRFGPMNSMHYAWQYITTTYGYDANSNELTGLTASVGFKCYLVNMVATYTKESYDFIMETYDVGVLEQLGPSPSSGWTPSNPYTYLADKGIGQSAPQPTYVVSTTAVDDYVTITYEFTDATGKITQRSENVAITGISDEDYHQVRYKRQDGKYGFFTYLHGSGTYPGIDIAYQLDYDDLGTYYPWTYFRLQNQRVGEDYAFPDVYKDAKKWCKYIGVNYDSISDGVHTDNDVDDVAQCILQIAVKPGDQNQGVLEYLFKHFSALHENARTQPELSFTLPDKMLTFSSSPSQLQNIRDRYFGQSFQFSGITSSRHAGSIGRVGTYSGHYGYVPQNAQFVQPVNPSDTVPETKWDSQPAYVYRRQVLDAVYEEVAVFGLRVNYQVHYKKGFGAGAGDPELLVPIDREILRTVSVAKREQVVCRGMYMLVNTVIITKTPWYASSLFKAILLVVAVVITVLSLGQAWQTIVAAASIGTLATIYVIFTLVLQYIVVTVAVKMFVKKFGAKLGFIAAVAAIAIGGYNAIANPQSMFADSLVGIGNGLAKQSNIAYADQLQDIYQEMADFQEWSQGQFDSLNEKRDELGLNAQWQGLTGFDFVGLSPVVRLGESPNDYYSRTVHSGNIGVTAYDMVETYAAYKLQLPQLSDTQELMSDGDLLS